MHVGSWPLYVWHTYVRILPLPQITFTDYFCGGLDARSVRFRGGAIVIFKGVLLYGFFKRKSRTVSKGRGGAGRKSVL